MSLCKKILLWVERGLSWLRTRGKLVTKLKLPGILVAMATIHIMQREARAREPQSEQVAANGGDSQTLSVHAIKNGTPGIRASANREGHPFMEAVSVLHRPALCSLSAPFDHLLTLAAKKKSHRSKYVHREQEFYSLVSRPYEVGPVF